MADGAIAVKNLEVEIQANGIIRDAKTGYIIARLVDSIKFENIESNLVEAIVMPKIAEEKLVLQWKESKMIGGEPVYYLDESHAVCIKDYIDQIEIWFFERTEENGKHYCRVTKKHFLDARKIKENYEILLNA